MGLRRILTPMRCSASVTRCATCSINFASDVRGTKAAPTFMSPLKIREMPQDERPREKLLARGVDALTDAELIAILLRTGLRGANAVEVGRQLLEEYKSLEGLSRCSAKEFSKIPGIGQTKALELVAAFALGKRLA